MAKRQMCVCTREQCGNSSAILSRKQKELLLFNFWCQSVKANKPELYHLVDVLNDTFRSMFSCFRSGLLAILCDKPCK